MKSKAVKTIRGADHFIANKCSDVYKEFESILNAIDNINEQTLISKYQEQQETRPDLKGLSVVLNAMIKTELQKENWTAESFVFKDKEYQIKGQKGRPSAWQLDHVKNKISLEVSFNHTQHIATNLIKPTIASEENHVEKAINTEMAAIVCLSNNLKSVGNFDNAVASTTDWLRYLKPYSQILTAPLVFIEIEAPSSFFIPRGGIGTIVKNEKEYQINKIARIGDTVKLGNTLVDRKPQKEWLKNSQEVQIENYSIVDGKIEIEVIDDSGKRSTGFSGKGRETKYTPGHFSSI